MWRMVRGGEKRRLRRATTKARAWKSAEAHLLVASLGAVSAGWPFERTSTLYQCTEYSTKYAGAAIGS